MKRSIILLALLSTLAAFNYGCVVAAGPPGPPPAPMVEVYGPAPYPGAVWVVGDWHWHSGHRNWEWHRGHWR